MKILKCVIHEIHEDHEVYNPIEYEDYMYYSEYEVMRHKNLVHLKSIQLVTFVWGDIPCFTPRGFNNHVFMVDEHM